MPRMYTEEEWANAPDSFKGSVAGQMRRPGGIETPYVRENTDPRFMPYTRDTFNQNGVDIRNSNGALEGAKNVAMGAVKQTAAFGNDIMRPFVSKYGTENRAAELANAQTPTGGQSYMRPDTAALQRKLGIQAPRPQQSMIGDPDPGEPKRGDGSQLYGMSTPTAAISRSGEDANAYIRAMRAKAGNTQVSDNIQRTVGPKGAISYGQTNSPSAYDPAAEALITQQRTDMARQNLENQRASYARGDVYKAMGDAAQGMNANDADVRAEATKRMQALSGMGGEDIRGGYAARRQSAQDLQRDKEFERRYGKGSAYYEGTMAQAENDRATAKARRAGIGGYTKNALDEFNKNFAKENGRPATFKDFENHIGQQKVYERMMRGKSPQMPVEDGNDYARGGAIPQRPGLPQVSNGMQEIQQPRLDPDRMAWANYVKAMANVDPTGRTIIPFEQFQQSRAAAQGQMAAMRSPEVQAGQILANGGLVEQDYAFADGGAVQRSLWDKLTGQNRPQSYQTATAPQPAPQQQGISGYAGGTATDKRMRDAGLATGGAIPVQGQELEGIEEAEGGPTDDSIPAVIDGSRPAALSSGEFVYTAAATEAVGAPVLKAVMKGLEQGNPAVIQAVMQAAIKASAAPKKSEPSEGYALGGRVSREEEDSVFRQKRNKAMGDPNLNTPVAPTYTQRRGDIGNNPMGTYSANKMFDKVDASWNTSMGRAPGDDGRGWGAPAYTGSALATTGSPLATTGSPIDESQRQQSALLGTG